MEIPTVKLSNGLDLTDLFQYLMTENARLEEEFGPVEEELPVNISDCIKLLPEGLKSVCQQALRMEKDLKPYAFDQQDSANNIEFSDKGEVMGISFDKLIEKITEEGWPDLANVAFHTFPLFCSPQDLLEALISRHHIPNPPMMAASELHEFTIKKIRSVQSRVASLIKKWMKLWPEHFTENIAFSSLLRSYLEELQENSSSQISRTNAELIQQTWDGLREKANMKKVLFGDMRIPPSPILPKEIDFKTNELLTWSPLEIARQLSIIENNLLKRIRVGELLGANWEKPNKDDLAPNVCKINERFIRARLLFISSIVGQSDLNNRVKILKKLLEVAQECLNSLFNYESPFIINSALKSDAIRSLHLTVKELGKSAMHKAIWARLEELYEPSYGAIRLEMQNNPTGIPCFLALRQELKKNDSLHPNYLESGLINVAKHAVTTSIIERVMMYQHHNLCLHRVRSLASFLKAKGPPIDDESLLVRARALEPIN